MVRSRGLYFYVSINGRKNDTEFSAEEAMSLEKMLGAMLIYDPRKWATAKDVIGSDWMNRWGLPALQKFLGTA